MSCSCPARNRRLRSRFWAMPEKEERQRDVAVNRRAYQDYFIDEKLEAGIMLTGPEVKSVRNGRTNLRDGGVRIDGNAAWLENVHISPYEQAKVEVGLARGKGQYEKREAIAESDAKREIARAMRRP